MFRRNASTHHTHRAIRAASASRRRALVATAFAAISLASGACAVPAKAAQPAPGPAPTRPGEQPANSAGGEHVAARSTRATTVRYRPWMRPVPGARLQSGGPAAVAVPCEATPTLTWAAPPWVWNEDAYRWEPGDYWYDTGLALSPRLPWAVTDTSSDFTWVERGGDWRAVEASDLCHVRSRRQGVDFRALGGRSVRPSWVTAGSVDRLGMRVAAMRLGQLPPALQQRLVAGGFSGVFSAAPMTSIEGFESLSCVSAEDGRTCDSLPGWGGGPYEGVGAYINPLEERLPRRHGEVASLTLHELGHSLDDATGWASQGSSFTNGPWAEARTCVSSEYFRGASSEWYAEIVARVYAQRRTYSWMRRHCPRSTAWMTSRFGAPRFNDAWRGSAYVVTLSGTGRVRVRSIDGRRVTSFRSNTRLAVRPGRAGRNVQVRAAGRWWVLPLANASLSNDGPVV